jgi:hypothetical protein
MRKPEKPKGLLSPAPAKDASRKSYGKWQITDTVSSTRKNLFSIDPQSGYHVGTIISGSRSKLDRFERSLTLIRAAPDMLYVLDTVAASLRAGEELDTAELLSLIDSVLERVASPTGEG